MPAKEAERERLETEAAQPGLWDDAEAAQKTLRRIATLKETAETWRSLEWEVRSLAELADLAITEGVPELEPELQRDLDAATRRLDRLEAQAMFSGPYARRGAIVSVQAGAGGIDSQDWAQMLVAMYVRWAEAHGYQARVLESVPGEEAGIKRADLEVQGDYVYGYLKAEAGVHRLIRLSPFDNQHLRHTSFVLIEMLPEAESDVEVTINPEDLRLDYFRSSGAGGQNVQKTSTAVRMVHVPTGITVTCQNERSQLRNREIALKILRARLIDRELARRREEEAKLRGEYISPEWGNQIRTYVLHPYKMVKDHRTGYEVSDPEAVLNGDLDGFLLAYLRSTVGAGAGR
ncbi:MAG: peptide chain release factor 2 [Chloroflexi bacterium]|nr:peptide chain release factor 2 [Chloroflexota bacterium]